MQNTKDKTNNTIENKALVTSVAISSDGNYVVTGDETGKVQLWYLINEENKNIDLITKNENVNPKHKKKVLSLGINADEKNIKIVSGGADGQVLLWNINVQNPNNEVSIEKLYP